jgi:hypothetical protein
MDDASLLAVLSVENRTESRGRHARIGLFE